MSARSKCLLEMHARRYLFDKIDESRINASYRPQSRVLRFRANFIAFEIAFEIYMDTCSESTKTDCSCSLIISVYYDFYLKSFSEQFFTTIVERADRIIKASKSQSWGESSPTAAAYTRYPVFSLFPLPKLKVSGSFIPASSLYYTSLSVGQANKFVFDKFTSSIALN